MDVKKALERAKSRTNDAKKRLSAKQNNRNATVSGVIQFFRDAAETNNYGEMAPITKENRNKVNGFIKFLKNNGFEDRQIYDFLEKCIKNWDFLASLTIHTDKRKKYNLDTRPNLVDIIHCKTQIYMELNKNIDEDIDLLEAWGEMK